MENNEMDRCLDLLVEKLKKDNMSLQQQISSYEAWQPNSWNSNLQIESQKKTIEGMTEIIKTAVIWLRSNELFIKSIQLQTMLEEIEKGNPNPFYVGDIYETN